MVEESTGEGLRLNQPAGHVEGGESLLDAAVRETLEETGYTVAPTEVVGIYRWQRALGLPTYVRVAFVADVVAFDPQRHLDAGIVRAVWLPPSELRSLAHRHRSPLVLRCVDDFAAGRRYPLELLRDVT